MAETLDPEKLRWDVIIVGAGMGVGTFTASFDILPGAKPFTVQTTCAAGSAVISINPAANTWQATYTVPTGAARAGNFSGAGFTVTDFLGNNMPFPGNEVPLSRMDPIALSAANALALPNVASTTGPSPNGTWSASGTLPAGGHFTIGTGTNPPPNFGGFINLTSRGAQSAAFSLYVDGQLVASKQSPSRPTDLLAGFAGQHPRSQTAAEDGGPCPRFLTSRPCLYSVNTK